MECLKRFWSVSLLLLALTPLAANAQSVIFSDTFNRTTGLGSNWSVLYGSYSTDGTFAVSGTPPINGNWASPVPSLGTDDYAVSADILIPSNSVDSGLFARSYDSAQFDMTMYAVKINTDGTVNLYRRVEWDWTLLSSVPAGIAANTFYTVKLVVTGANPVHLEAWVNGTRRISYDDASASQITVGRAGLVNYIAGVKYENFKVETVPSHLFADYFDRTSGLGSKWSVAYGSFTTDGARAVSGTPPSNGNWAQVVPSLGTNDYSVSATLSIPSGSFNSGVVARSSVPGFFDSDLYSALLAVDGTVSLYRRNGWSWASLGSVNAGIVPNTTYDLKLSVSGSNPVHLEVWLNGTLRITHDDTTASRITSGVPGIQNYAAGVAFSELFVDAVSSNPVTNVTVSAARLGNGSGTITSSPAGITCPGTCSMQVPKGTLVSFFPNPATGSTFNGWSGACQGLTGCSVTANNDQTVFGTFSITTETVNVSVNGSGTVTSNPSGINCPSGSCGMTVNYGTSVTLTASPASGYTFSGWSGACSGTGTCTLSGTSNASVTANFAFNPPLRTVTVTSSGWNGSVVSTSPSTAINCPAGSCSMSVTNGSTVTLVATAAAGYDFQGWSGACSGTGACTFTAFSNATVSASFKARQTYPCGNHPCARGEFPPASWRPYGANSAFNKMVPSSPQLMSNSSNRVTYLLDTLGTAGRADHFWFPPDGSSGWPTYYGNSNDPLFSVTCTWYGGTCDPDVDDDFFRAPSGAKVQGNNPSPTAGDRHFTFVDQTQVPMMEFDLWGAETSPLPNFNGTIRTQNAGKTYVMDGSGQNIGNGDGTAGHVGNLAGRIRAEEFTDAVANQSYINHALAIAIKCINGDAVYPSIKKSGMKICPSTTYALPMGARLWLDMSFTQINNLNIPEWKKVLLRTLNKYGAIVMDTNSSNVFWQWQTESGNQYLSLSVEDKWQTFGLARVNEGPSSDWYYTSAAPFPGYTGTFHEGDDNLPNGWKVDVWSKLKVLHPCVSDGSCNP